VFRACCPVSHLIALKATGVLRISVIIPAFNEEQAIAATIQSAVAAGADEVLVVDGGSSDRTVEVAGQTSATVIQSASGRAVQQNAGAAQATGDVLLFLHADCRLSPGVLQEIRERLTDAADIVGGFCRQQIDNSGRIYRAIEAGNLARARLLKWAYGDQAIFVTRDVFRRLGGFPELRFMEDLFLMKRLKRQGRIQEIWQPIRVSARRWEQRGVVRQTLTNWVLVLAAQLGICPNRLAHFYPRKT
jgi:rSAM/selenodomain-associated transferase 2